MKKSTRAPTRVGLRLLILLWMWAGCVFLVVDLFLNAPGLDGIRPRSPLYRGMRMAAHEMVGEPILVDAEVMELLSSDARGASSVETQEIRDAGGRPVCRLSVQRDADGMKIWTGSFTAWHRDGRLWIDGEYRMGKPHGTWRVLYPDGETELVATYADGKLVQGTTRVWGKDGLEVYSVDESILFEAK